MVESNEQANEIISLWFTPGQENNWFNSSQNFDEEIKSRFAKLYALAREGKLNSWQENPLSALALIILLDQFPRNMFRNTPQAFESDHKAINIAKAAISKGLDKELISAQKRFLYMPFMHSEILADQEEGVKLFNALGEAQSADYMERHYDIIKRFNRFPHRNKTLGRTSTEEEIEFLKTPNSSF